MFICLKCKKKWTKQVVKTLKKFSMKYCSHSVVKPTHALPCMYGAVTNAVAVCLFKYVTHTSLQSSHHILSWMEFSCDVLSYFRNKNILDFMHTWNCLFFPFAIRTVANKKRKKRQENRERWGFKTSRLIVVITIMITENENNTEMFVI